MGIGGLSVVSGDPDVSVTIPAVIAVMPGPTGVLVWGWGDDFDWTRRGRANPDDNLGLCDARNK